MKCKKLCLVMLAVISLSGCSKKSIYDYKRFKSDFEALVNINDISSDNSFVAGNISAKYKLLDNGFYQYQIELTNPNRTYESFSFLIMENRVKSVDDNYYATIGYHMINNYIFTNDSAYEKSDCVSNKFLFTWLSDSTEGYLKCYFTYKDNGERKSNVFKVTNYVQIV
ncbi:MAG: hypothetical protein HUJ61_06695 [Bacilli bacterium]|nr:hypothetical protein [Bacilli bacterium]